MIGICSPPGLWKRQILANSARVARGDLVQNVAFLTGLLHREAYNRYAINLVLFNLRPFWSDCKLCEMDLFHDPHKKRVSKAVCSIGPENALMDSGVRFLT